jgi:hypothetical protein
MSSHHLAISVLAACALGLASCAKPTGPVIGIPPVVDTCPVEGSAPLLPSPVAPGLTDVERGKVFMAMATAIDPMKAQALVRYWEAEMPSWGRLGWDRLAKIKPYCDAKVK